MKKFVTIMLSSTVIATMLSTSVSATDLNIDGNSVNTNIEISNGKAVAPVRDILESLNYSVNWNNDTKSIDAQKNNNNSNISLESKGDLKDAKPIFGLGELFKSDNFTGNVYLNNIANDSGVAIANVTFEKGCINKWHIHDHIQILMGSMGEGYCQKEGEDPQLMKVGDIVIIPAGVKHWHGATHESQFTHLSISGPVVEGMEAFGTKWLEPVSEEIYSKLK
ncbi:MAG: cupin domain-containing protein [Lachnospirales bacterium]